MSELVKGITIPDEAYLDYATGEGPQLVNRNQAHTLLTEDGETLTVQGMRLSDVFTVRLEQGATGYNDDNPVIASDGLSLETALDLAAFAPGVATLFVRDSDTKILDWPLEITLEAKP